MASRLAIGTSARERLRRLAVVFAVQLRMKIVVELYMRDMSARLFFREFGGGSPAWVSQNFRRLEKELWLRRVYEEGPGGHRHGGIEHFYRATELPFIDAESWALLPYSVRITSSWNMFRHIAPRLRGDLEATPGAARHRRELSCTTFQLDEEGWNRAHAATGERFVNLFEEQEDARRRTQMSGEELIRSDIFLIAFQSAGDRAQSSPGDLLLEQAREPLVRFPERLVPILKDDVSFEIVTEMNRQELSVTQFHREFGGASKPGISRRFKALVGSGWAAKGRQETGGTRRGAKEQFYCATKPLIHSYDPCADPPATLKGTEGWNTFERLCAVIKEAMAEATFDARAEHYLTWSLVQLDRQGWENVIAEIESLAEFIVEEQKQAKIRMAKSGEQPIEMTVGLGAFEAMKELIIAP
jgi:hypothetical protein